MFIITMAISYKTAYWCPVVNVQFIESLSVGSPVGILNSAFPLVPNAACAQLKVDASPTLSIPPDFMSYVLFDLVDFYNHSLQLSPIWLTPKIGSEFWDTSVPSGSLLFVTRKWQQWNKKIHSWYSALISWHNHLVL